MTISTTIIKNSYSGNGSTSAFTYSFKITDDDDDIPGNEARDKLQEDIDNFIQKSNSLNFYLYKLNQGHWVITKGEESLEIPLIGPSSAMSMAEDIRELS
ncbi:MAG TPA: hypothetical protein DCM40_22920, partial [Maribacter sp.]|nr:hypothetical protein [Maribacter sp.]